MALSVSSEEPPCWCIAPQLIIFVNFQCTHMISYSGELLGPNQSGNVIPPHRTTVHFLSWQFLETQRDSAALYQVPILENFDGN